MMSAALLAVITAAVYAGIDGPAAVSGTQRARAQASDLAQKDQERLRAMRFSDLQNYAPPAQAFTVDGITYNVASRADWVSDDDSTGACAPNDGSGDYLAISSTVTWTSLGAGRPVTARSVMAPPVNSNFTGTGDVVVKLQNQAGNPLSGITVQLNGKTNLSKTTNSDGCAVFTSVPSGNYTAVLNTAGYVDPTGNQLVSMPAPVAAGSTTTLTHQYALAGAVEVAFKGSNGSALTFGKASVSGGSLSTPKVLSGAAPLTTGKTLFPSVGYSAWAGTCTDPGAAYDGTATPAPGGTAIATVTVPTYTVKVSSSGLSPAPHLVLTPSAAGCTDKYVPTATNSGGFYTWTLPMPYGNYKLCADLSGSMTSPPFSEPNLTAAGTTVNLTLVKNQSGTITGVSDGSTTTGITSGTCP